MGDEAGGSGGVGMANLARERAVLLTLATVQFTSIVDFMVIMPLGPQLMRTLAITPAQFGLIVSSYTISAGVAGVVASSLIDRFGRKSAFLSLYVGFLIGTLLCGLATTYPLLLAARVVTGAFGGVLGGMAMAIIGDVFPDERRGRATGFLMSAFSLASVFGVPFGLYLGTRYDWHAPFLMLVALGLPVLLSGMIYLPPLRDHLKKGHSDTWGRLVETYTHPNHLRAFALVTSLMLGTFMVVPFISPYFVANVGLREKDLPWLYVGGGICSLISSPLIGRWADFSGKLKVYRIIAPASALIMLTITTLGNVGLYLAVASVSILMVSNSGRMVAAMAMINASVEPRLRGGFMSAYSSVQHIAAGLGSFFAGLIIVEGPDHTLRNYGWVGLIGMASTLASIWFAGRLRPASVPVATEVYPVAELIETVAATAEAF
jgi:MFS transporter, DHA1 family, inner membrane transport protein